MQFLPFLPILCVLCSTLSRTLLLNVALYHPCQTLECIIWQREALWKGNGRGHGGGGGGRGEAVHGRNRFSCVVIDEDLRSAAAWAS